MSNIQYRVLIEEIRDGIIVRRCESTRQVHEHDSDEFSDDNQEAMHGSMMTAAASFFGPDSHVQSLSLFLAGVAVVASESGMVQDWAYGPFADMHGIMDLVDYWAIGFQDKLEDHIKIVVSDELRDAIVTAHAKQGFGPATNPAYAPLGGHAIAVDHEVFTALGSPRR